jgi:protein required for attachment to host cells
MHHIARQSLKSEVYLASRKGTGKGGLFMTNVSSKHWVLVADSGQARILELQNRPYEFRQVQELVSESQHQASRDLVSDASGRAFHNQGPSSHAIQPRSDAHDRAEQQFSLTLVRKLEKAADLGAFDHLLIIADPKTLGRLRQQMSKSLANRVCDELNLDLAGLPLNKLESRIRTILGWQT